MSDDRWEPQSKSDSWGSAIEKVVKEILGVNNDRYHGSKPHRNEKDGQYYYDDDGYRDEE